jgi:carbon-monoxide dehydrogenase large subunit
VNDGGQPVKRDEHPRLVTGHGAFVDDRTCPDRLHAVVRSRSAHPQIRSVDGAAARTRPGVVAVLTQADSAGVLKEIPARAVDELRTPKPPCWPRTKGMTSGKLSPGW